jgi:hypothetical protein
MAAAAALANPKVESAKMGLLEDDNELEEFDINQGMHPATPSPQLVMGFSSLLCEVVVLSGIWFIFLLSLAGRAEVPPAGRR